MWASLQGGEEVKQQLKDAMLTALPEQFCDSMERISADAPVPQERAHVQDAQAQDTRAQNASAQALAALKAYFPAASVAVAAQAASYYAGYGNAIYYSLGGAMFAYLTPYLGDIARALVKSRAFHIYCVQIVDQMLEVMCDHLKRQGKTQANLIAFLNGTVVHECVKLSGHLLSVMRRSIGTAMSPYTVDFMNAANDMLGEQALRSVADFTDMIMQHFQPVFESSMRLAIFMVLAYEQKGYAKNALLVGRTTTSAHRILMKFIRGC